MRTLSNNRNNAFGPFYVYSNNGPSNANANNWGGRTPTQGGKSPFPCPILQRMVLNQSAYMPKLIKGGSVHAGASLLPFLRDGEGRVRAASQPPLKKRGLVGAQAPLEEARAERDALHTTYFREAA